MTKDAKGGSKEPSAAPHDARRAEIERLDREKPDFDALIADGTIHDEPATMLAKVQLDGLMMSLKQRRIERGMTIKDVIEASGLSRVLVSQLENGRTLNPTLDTLFRYAIAVGLSIRLEAEELEG